MESNNLNIKQLTSSYYCIILDESGSMYDHKNDTLGSIKQFLDDQKSLSTPESQLQLITFNTTAKLRWTGNINQNLDFIYHPEGCTALYDAINFAIQSTEKEYEKLTEEGRKPIDVYVIIITDGEENASQTYKQEHINNMIKQKQEVFKWKFIYLGANQDAFKSGAKIGINKDTCLNYAQNAMATPQALKSVSKAIYRQKSTRRDENMSFTDCERYASNTA